MPRVWPVILSLAVSSPALAARSVPHDQPVAVRLEHAQPTAVVLPEPVASVSLGVAKERFSLDYDGPYLFLQALEPTVAGRLFVVGQSGTLYTVLFRVGTPVDDVVHLVTPPTPAHAVGASAQPLGVSTYLRALKTGTALPGQTPADLPPPVRADARLTVTGTQAFAWGSTLGLVVALRNTSIAPLTLNLRVGLDLVADPGEGVAHVSTWGLLPRVTVTAVAADDEVLSPGASTRVYLLGERRP